MPGRPPGYIVLGIVRTLEEQGEATRAEVFRALRLTRDEVSAVMSRMGRTSKMHAKRIHIVRWIYDDEDGRRYPRAVYALGDLPDAPKPRAQSHTRNQKRYRAARRARVASVFDLAVPLRQRM